MKVKEENAEAMEKDKAELWIINSESQCLRSCPWKHWLPAEIRAPVR